MLFIVIVSISKVIKLRGVTGVIFKGLIECL